MKLTKLSVLAMVVGALSLTVLSGCETLTETPGQQRNRMARAIDTNGKQIPDDVESVLLIDKPSTLTKKAVPSY